MAMVLGRTCLDGADSVLGWLTTTLHSSHMPNLVNPAIFSYATGLKSLSSSRRAGDADPSTTISARQHREGMRKRDGEVCVCVRVCAEYDLDRGAMNYDCGGTRTG